MSRRPFAALAVAQALSLSGTRLTMIALPWLVLTLTGDAFATGLTAFAEMAPYVLVKALSGPFIDRFGARRVAVLGDLASALAVAAVPLVALTGGLGLGLLLPLVFVMGAMRGPADAAKQALVPEVAEAGGLPLERVTGTLGTIDRLATTLGAGAAGALVALIGAAPALAVTAVTFLASALAVGAGVAQSQPAGAEAQAGYRRAFTEGWAFLRGDPVLLAIVAMVAMTNLIDQAMITVLLPVWARDVGGGAGAFGGMVAAFSAFAVLGALIATTIGEKLPRLPVFALAFLIAGAPRFLALLPGVPWPVLITVLVLSGFAAGFINPIISAVMFERIPRRLTGRVTALTSALFWALMPLGGLAGGAAVTALGLSGALILAGTVYFAATMLPLLLRTFRALDARPLAS
ncbi:MFS transporter [Sinisalibacter aestuarii]|uniref:Drug antiporter protein n=1 Tax=Sinisalibacter aestuarii TaxID=2949426 RepID=A0ABQ5LWV5_9RHOB|nr:MFS transporter [Sinisalibacter aestuarii]GKY89457.1 putative drug antiporter protein precursor [Sinisalibacter aestuarii]